MTRKPDTVAVIGDRADIGAGKFSGTIAQANPIFLAHAEFPVGEHGIEITVTVYIAEADPTAEIRIVVGFRTGEATAAVSEAQPVWFTGIGKDGIEGSIPVDITQRHTMIGPGFDGYI